MKYGIIGVIVIACSVLFGISVGAAVIKVRENTSVSAASGVVRFSMPVPSGASGKLEMDVADDTGVSRANQQIIAGVSKNVSIDVSGSDTEVLSVVLTRNDKTAVAGTYLFDFKNNTSSVVTEDIAGAFKQIGALEASADDSASDLFGDINYDGSVNAADSAEILAYSAEVGAGYTGTLREYMGNQ